MGFAHSALGVNGMMLYIIVRGVRRAKARNISNMTMEMTIFQNSPGLLDLTGQAIFTVYGI